MLIIYIIIMLSNQIVVTQLTVITVLLINDSSPAYCWVILQAGKPRKLAYDCEKLVKLHYTVYTRYDYIMFK